MHAGLGSGSQGLPEREGDVIALHLSYSSRGSARKAPGGAFVLVGVDVALVPRGSVTLAERWRAPDGPSTDRP